MLPMLCFRSPSRDLTPSTYTEAMPFTALRTREAQKTQPALVSRRWPVPPSTVRILRRASTPEASPKTAAR